MHRKEKFGRYVGKIHVEEREREIPNNISEATVGRDIRNIDKEDRADEGNPVEPAVALAPVAQMAHEEPPTTRPRKVADVPVHGAPHLHIIVISTILIS